MCLGEILQNQELQTNNNFLQLRKPFNINPVLQLFGFKDGYKGTFVEIQSVLKSRWYSPFDFGDNNEECDISRLTTFK